MNFLEKIQAQAAHVPGKTALEMREPAGEISAISYQQLEDAVRRTMSLLESKGIRPGDRVALQLPKGLPFIYLHLATMRLGAVCLPLNPGYPPHELGYFLKDAETRLFFADAGQRDAIDPLADTLPALEECVYLHPEDDTEFPGLIGVHDASAVAPPEDLDATCLMIYTSGTTGRPKGAMLTVGNLSANLTSLHEAWGWRQDDVILHVLPIFHVHGLIVALLGALYAGAQAVLLPRFDAAKTVEMLENDRFTVFMGVPTIHRRLVEAAGGKAHDLSHMRLMTSGSDRLPDDLFAAFQEIFGYTLLERYGMSETGMLISNPLEGERRVGSVGKPLPGVEVRIVDPGTGEALPDGEVGAVQVRGDNVCKGYWRQPEKTAAAFTEDGWLRTGDMGLREPDGYFTLKGRAKDLIISGGYNVYPPEVELVLAEHPDVAASAVIGCPDREWGERVTALIISRPGSALSEEDIVEFCRERLVNYKVPRRVIIAEDFPRNALGKVQKARLRDTFCT